jgi:dTDP-4-amino-4,6-dideoxygalactose transaminase
VKSQPDPRDRRSLTENGISQERIVFGAPLLCEEEIEEVVRTLQSGWIGRGPKVSAFEDAFARFKGTTTAVAVSSGSAALHLALLAAGIGPGDEVITTALTFCATVNAIIHSGGTPVLIDVGFDSMNLDVAQIERAINPRTKAILPVHFAGRPCEMAAIMDIARRHNLAVVEDCAHAIEAEDHGVPVGTIGDFGCFSFYPTKNITSGDGGMILTRDPDAADRLRTLSQQGMSRDAWKRFSEPSINRYLVQEIGFKYNMCDLNASIGVQQLKRINAFWDRRKQIWDQYDAAFKDLPVVLPAPISDSIRHALHLYTILIDARRSGFDRDSFIERLNDQGITSGVHYLCLAEHPAYQDRFGWRPEHYPSSTRIGRQTVSLPLSPGMPNEAVERTVRAVCKIFD